MPEAHVVLLPDTTWDQAPLAAEVVGHGVDAFVPVLSEIPDDLPPPLADARRVAMIAMWLNDHAVPAPIVLVAHGDCARLLPALSLAQRSAHRLVTGYVILDPPATPAPSLEWPDAPVWWVATATAPQPVIDGALSARLRGFHVMTEVAPVTAVLAALG